jgi:hypothetical protein
MKRALLVLTPTERAIFNTRAATEGVHRSRPHPTGAALLGWAARSVYDRLTADRAWHIFHSGTVRFSDALPLVHDGHVAFPAPKILVALKTAGSVVSAGNRLDRNQVWVGRRAFKDDEQAGGQIEALKVPFLTDQLEVFAPPGGGRLRTATDMGRAKEQALFGYSHLEPVATPGTTAADEAIPVRYAATIEGELEGDEWKMLRDAFTSQPLRLGRASRTSYGGWYKCQWCECSDPPVEPDPVRDYFDFWREKPLRDELTSGNVLIRVWLLSDLAVTDDNGVPCFSPASEILGLPAGGELDGTESVTEMRRYAPWNGKLKGRDVERQVIAAGSVLTYRYREPVAEDWKPSSAKPKTAPLTAGLFQEQGLGRLWVDPPILREHKPVLAEEDEAVPAAAGSGEPVHTHDDAPPPGDLARWAQAMAGLADAGEREDLGRRWVFGLDTLLRRAGKDGPSPAQWHDVANAARAASDHADIIVRLFGAENGVCGSSEASTRGGDWLAGEPKTVRQWLQEQLTVARNTPVHHIRWALDHLARDRAQKRRENTERRHG